LLVPKLEVRDVQVAPSALVNNCPSSPTATHKLVRLEAIAWTIADIVPVARVHEDAVLESE
jgi:hypothetical protein